MKEFSEEDCIALICNGEFDDVPGYPIGELFEEFFDNINYNVVRDNEIFVDFTGEAFCDGEPCEISIRFKIYDDIEHFEIREVKVNDDILEGEEVLDLLDDIAFTSGAVMDNPDYGCTHDCSNCMNDCSLNENLNLETITDDMDYEDLNEDELDIENKDDDNNDDD